MIPGHREPEPEPPGLATAAPELLAAAPVSWAGNSVVTSAVVNSGDMVAPLACEVQRHFWRKQGHGGNISGRYDQLVGI